jgi:hypothetical protein
VQLEQAPLCNERSRRAGAFGACLGAVVAVVARAEVVGGRSVAAMSYPCRHFASELAGIVAPGRPRSAILLRNTRAAPTKTQTLRASSPPLLSPALPHAWRISSCLEQSRPDCHRRKTRPFPPCTRPPRTATRDLARASSSWLASSSR